MAISKSLILGNTVVHLEARGVLAPREQPQVVIRIRFIGFDSSANTLSILQAAIHRFHLGQIPLPRALPTMVSTVVARIHGVHATVRRLCNDLLLSFSSLVSAQMMAGSALELLIQIGLLLGPGASNQDVELMHDWMLENPPEEEEEMGGAVYDHYLYEGVDVSHGGFGGVPASRSFIEGLQRSPYGRGDGVREEQCVICLEKFDARAEVSKTPCSHAFHSRCIIQWLEMSNLCSICRSQMPAACSH
ncbi:probable E3 ubiquitin-protein ligase RHB1A [Phoenix dactylifera]|uniref:Probable E3 ubiquitin-protein ligase RHB1A n=1 Tax=Phoenix dactylifera TaxID=42345 RepID=A0A8B7D0Q0_PHODC|nr:probable E3 ubiquitin-protein ligase RHB1A [Phoenix dactylifera]